MYLLQVIDVPNPVSHINLKSVLWKTADFVFTKLNDTQKFSGDSTNIKFMLGLSTCPNFSDPGFALQVLREICEENEQNRYICLFVCI